MAWICSFTPNCELAINSPKREAVSSSNVMHRILIFSPFSEAATTAALPGEPYWNHFHKSRTFLYLIDYSSMQARSCVYRPYSARLTFAF